MPLDTDNDHIPDSIDDNDDNDGLSDKLEIKLGSDPKNNSDVLAIKINDAIHFLIDIDMDGESDLFYNSIRDISELLLNILASLSEVFHRIFLT